jgi:hypothetical protein
MRGRGLGKHALLIAIIVMLVMQRRMVHAVTPAPNGLHGIWAVETFTIDGSERPPLLTDATRWRKLVVSPWTFVIRYMTDVREVVRGAALDESTRTIRIPIPDSVRYEEWHYVRSDADHLVIDGTYRGAQLHVTLAREPEPLLATRGFHWIQDEPFNR